MARALPVLILCALVPVPAAAQPRTCTAAAQTAYVRDVMTDVYLWSSEMPAADPRRYPSPDAYLEAVRYRPLDSHFSYITSRAANEAYYGDSQYVGLGVSWTVVGNQLRVLQVFPESPASEAGLARGDRVLTIGGRPVAALLEDGGLDAAIGASEIGVTVALEFADRSGATHAVQLAKRVATIPTVSQTRLYATAGRRVGYIFFRNFVEPSVAALDSAVAQLTSAGLDYLVLDLRYNGGGLVSVARHLASLIGGSRTSGQVFTSYVHNANNRDLDQQTAFDDLPQALNLPRLIVITTPASASASELVINALRPFLPVVVIGDRTYGKPVGQYQYAFCDRMLAPVSFSVRNALDQGDYYDGIAADCRADDDIDHELGDVGEASLREALTFVATGSCSAAPSLESPATRLARSARRSLTRTGWKSIVNAD